MPDYNILCEIFLSLTPVKQVMVYAEALNLERYELLAHIDKCITPQRRTEFMAAVELWRS